MYSVCFSKCFPFIVHKTLAVPFAHHAVRAMQVRTRNVHDVANV